MYFGDQAKSDIDAGQVRWFDDWPRDVENGLSDDPPVRLFVMGGHRWREESEWPPRRAETTAFFLHSDGAPNSLNGNGALTREPSGEEEPDVFVYEPRSPVMSFGRPVLLS